MNKQPHSDDEAKKAQEDQTKTNESAGSQNSFDKEEVKEKYKSFYNKAEGLLKDKRKTQEKLDETSKKAEGLRNGPLKEVWDKLALMLSFLKAFISGELKDYPYSLTTVASVLGGVLYLLAPIDAIPDFFPFAGYIDDVVVLIWVYTAVEAELEKFKLWRDAKKDK